MWSSGRIFEGLLVNPNLLVYAAELAISYAKIEMGVRILAAQPKRLEARLCGSVKLPRMGKAQAQSIVSGRPRRLQSDRLLRAAIKPLSKNYP